MATFDVEGKGIVAEDAKDYVIIGGDCQIVNIRLAPGESVR
jgi:hypothetical protein